MSQKKGAILEDPFADSSFLQKEGLLPGLEQQTAQEAEKKSSKETSNPNKTTSPATPLSKKKKKASQQKTTVSVSSKEETNTKRTTENVEESDFTEEIIQKLQPLYTKLQNLSQKEQDNFEEILKRLKVLQENVEKKDSPSETKDSFHPMFSKSQEELKQSVSQVSEELHTKWLSFKADIMANIEECMEERAVSTSTESSLQPQLEALQKQLEQSFSELQSTQKNPRLDEIQLSLKEIQLSVANGTSAHAKSFLPLQQSIETLQRLLETNPSPSISSEKMETLLQEIGEQQQLLSSWSEKNSWLDETTWNHSFQKIEQSISELPPQQESDSIANELLSIQEQLALQKQEILEAFHSQDPKESIDFHESFADFRQHISEQILHLEQKISELPAHFQEFYKENKDLENTEQHLISLVQKVDHALEHLSALKDGKQDSQDPVLDQGKIADILEDMKDVRADSIQSLKNLETLSSQFHGHFKTLESSFSSLSSASETLSLSTKSQPSKAPSYEKKTIEEYDKELSHLVSTRLIVVGTILTVGILFLAIPEWAFSNHTMKKMFYLLALFWVGAGSFSLNALEGNWLFFGSRKREQAKDLISSKEQLQIEVLNEWSRKAGFTILSLLAILAGLFFLFF